MSRRIRTQVAIVGAGPAGLVLASVLLSAGIDAQIVERHPRAVIEQRARAGLLEHRVVEYLRTHHLADQLLAQGSRHGWCDFLCLGQRLRVDYATRVAGAHHWVYPQQLLVRDLVSALCRAGRPPHFDRPVTAVHAPAGDHPRIECADLDIHCDYLVGCDGARGITAGALPAAAPRGRLIRRYPYDWLTLLAEVDHPVEGVLYAVHERGFAGLMPRGHRLARLYLQVPPGDDPAHWPAQRVRQELRARLSGAGEVLPSIGHITETGVLRMHSSIRPRFQHGRLFLAGDAAHVLTPSGAKGMNLAIADAADVAQALVRRYRDDDPRQLAGYTARRLPQVLRTQEFSDRLLHLLHLPEPGLGDPRPALAHRWGQIRRLAGPDRHGIAFARWYVGAGPALPVCPVPPRPSETPALITSETTR